MGRDRREATGDRGQRDLGGDRARYPKQSNNTEIMRPKL